MKIPDKVFADEWLPALQAIMSTWDEKYGNLPYELPLGDFRCWRDSYDDGMSPQEAFDSDQTYWDA